MFVGRDAELQTLNRLYSKDTFQMVVLYGRRRIGKTTLITKFIEDKPALFFTAQEANDRINLQMFSKKVYRFFNIPTGAGHFEGWYDAFEFLAQKAKEQRFVLAFDEFPYAAEENKSLKSILQNVIDHALKDTNLFLILCGSHMSFMENEVLGYKSPLFGRRTAQIKLSGFDYFNASKMLASFSYEDKIKFYSCIGGTPHYIAQVDDSLSFEDNIKQLYFDISGYLYNEPMMLLQQELREPAMYNSIISAIAGGASKINEIATRLSEDRSKVNKYITTLMNLHILVKDYPFGEDLESSRKGIYKILDNCYAFWYRFVFQNLTEIESNTGGIVADAEVFGESLSNYIGALAFEEICQQYLMRKNLKGELPFTATSFGKWWGNDPVQKQQSDFDAIAANRKEKKILCCECKWKNTLADYTEIQKLMNKNHLLSEYQERYYYFFSKVDFSKQAKTLEKENKNLKLITLDMLFDN